MKEIGQLLKQTRETQGKTLEDVSAQTRIQLTTLQALENGEFGRLTNKAFIKGFLRQYAKVLGLDADELLAMFEKSHGSAKEAKPASVSKLDSNQLTEKANLLWFRTPSQFITLGAVVIILMLITSIYFISIKIISYSEETVRTESAPQQTQELPSDVLTTTPSPDKEDMAPPSPTTTLPTATPAAPATVQEQDPHGTEEEEAPPKSIAAAAETKQKMVTVEAREAVTVDVAWSTGKKETVQLNAQGKHVFYYLEKIKIVVSDGGAVKITTHEKSLGIPGESGKPITMNFR
ncbi:helix-turn-helix domain-containing protein [bacterium]|nr:helix-turn-helix domain-containing protein [bacterium]